MPVVQPTVDGLHNLCSRCRRTRAIEADEVIQRLHQREQQRTQGSFSALCRRVAEAEQALPCLQPLHNITEVHRRDLLPVLGTGGRRGRQDRQAAVGRGSE
eukprot:55587-Eustigmatos_ZCMA.PRE.1